MRTPHIARLAVLSVLFLAAPAAAFEEYNVLAHGSAVDSKQPPQELQGNISSTYNATLTWRATADRGIFRSRSKVENDFTCVCTPQIFPGPDRAYTLFQFGNIDGPPGPVNGTMHFTLEGKLENAGADPWGASVEYQVYVNDGSSGGHLYLGGGGLTGSGAFTGETSTTVDRAIDIPFSAETGEGALMVLVILETNAGGTGFGSGYNMGSANFWDDLNGDGLGGLHLRANGPAVTLPEGYVANSVAMGVVDNYWVTPTAGVPPFAGDRAGLALAAGSNPVRGGTAVHWVLPRAGSVRLEVLDLQGRVAATLADGWHEAGAGQARWAVSRMPAGLYFLRLAFEGEQVTTKVTVLE